MDDDTVVTRRILAVQLGTLAALAVMVTGPEAVDLSQSVAAQLPVLMFAVVVALLVEWRTRPRPVTEHL